MNKRQKKRRRAIALFTKFLDFAAIFARRSALAPLSNFILRRFADMTFLSRRGRRQAGGRELGQEWQRMFPSKIC